MNAVALSALAQSAGIPRLCDEDLERLAEKLAARLMAQSPMAAQTQTPTAKVVTLGEAVSEVLATKKRSGVRPTYLTSLRQYLTQFARGREHVPVSSFTEADIEQWFHGRNEAPITRQSNLGRLGALFTYAFRKRYISESPIARVERVRVTKTPPKILSVDQAEQLLRHCEQRKPVALAYLTLAMFAGVRPDEIGRLTWADIDLDRGIVTVSAAASKVRQRRIVHLHANAVEWLKEAKLRGSTLPVSHTTRRRYVWHFASILDLLAWPQDCLRHTAASYWLAEWRDAGKVAFELGNSPGILLRHYRELVTAEDAQRFWSIIPRAMQPLDKAMP